jgi:hypothetical protein
MFVYLYCMTLTCLLEFSKLLERGTIRGVRLSCITYELIDYQQLIFNCLESLVNVGISV